MSTEAGLLSSKSFRFAINASDKILLIDSSDVSVIEAQGSYVILHRLSGSLRVRSSISALTKDLEPRGFVRIHRSVLVNKFCILEIRKAATGEYMLRTSGGREYRIPRTCMHNLKAIAHVWIGTGTFSQEVKTCRVKPSL
ncbi:MAG TPA: LytTR family DNA-binding domain-containing protein [Candidatus Bathyarchaeia archaeon]|nr:LytTR family DNA-binding domain-containing protein [Candidatus Bathyarchaeia archaeon]